MRLPNADLPIHVDTDLETLMAVKALVKVGVRALLEALKDPTVLLNYPYKVNVALKITHAVVFQDSHDLVKVKDVLERIDRMFDGISNLPEAHELAAAINNIDKIRDAELEEEIKKEALSLLFATKEPAIDN